MSLSNLIQRDVYVMKKGDTITVKIDTDLTNNGWSGASYFAYTGSILNVDGYPIPVVRRGNGIQRGPVALWGSDEPEDKAISYTGQFTTYGYAQCFYGNTTYITRVFERDSYFDRTGLNIMTDFYASVYPVLNPVSFAPIYQPGQPLFISERGFLTTEQITSSHQSVAYIFQEPKTENSFFLGVGNVA